ncbi:MAG: RNA methyltransferase [Bacteroidales bacterium]
MRRKLKNRELGRIDAKAYKELQKMPIILVLDNIRSLNNIGSLFRTADGMRIQGIYLCGITACPPHRDIQKTALGATDSVPWKYFDSTLEAMKELKSNGYKLIALEQVEGAVMLNDYMPSEQTQLAVIVGNEVKGVDDEVVNGVDLCIEIPQFGTKHSFNVTISAGIVLWDFCSKIGFDKFV